MDYDRNIYYGKKIPEIARRALKIIQEYQSKGQTQLHTTHKSYTKGGRIIPTADLAAHRVYTNLFDRICPGIQVLAERKDADNPASIQDQPLWIVSGLNGSDNFSQRLDFGYGTQCALLSPDGSVPIAFVGNAVTNDIFGYFGNFETGKVVDKSIVKLQQINPEELLANLYGWHCSSLENYNPLSQALIKSRNAGRMVKRTSGISAMVTELLTDDVSIVALGPQDEQPWDIIPAYAVCERAGLVFMTPSTVDKKFVEWKPTYRPLVRKRGFDLFILHRSRLPQFHAAVARI